MKNSSLPNTIAMGPSTKSMVGLLLPDCSRHQGVAVGVHGMLSFYGGNPYRVYTAGMGFLLDEPLGVHVVCHGTGS